MKRITVAVIGAGTIGSAVAKALVNQDFIRRVIATRRSLSKLEGLKNHGIEVTSDNKKAAKESDVIILSIKPKDVKEVLLEICPEIEKKLVISLAAALSLEFLQEMCPKAKFIRAMPNIALLVRESFTAYAVGKDVNEEELEIAERIFNAFGKFVRVEEKYLDAITGLSGSGPAYASILLEALMYGGLYVGLPRDLSLIAAAQTILGTARLVIDLNMHPAEIRDMVITPGGTTIEGIYEIEDSNIRTAIIRAVDTATKKSKILSFEILSNQKKEL